MSMFYDVTQYGVTAGTKENQGPRINQLITEVSQKGGGTVAFPPGEYVTGAVCLKSNVTLYLSEGAVILASSDPQDYPSVTRQEIPGWNRNTCAGIIYALESENIAVRGRGTINGRGWNWWHKTEVRPRTIEVIGCRRVLIEDVEIINSPAWTVHPVCCHMVTIQNITIKNPANSPNTDGINPESCRDVHISNCRIDVGDDCITLKSGTEHEPYIKKQPCENIVITNCTMANGHGGVVMGSEMSGGVRNVTISNCVFQNTDRGLRIKTRRMRGGVVENIQVNNVIMEKVVCPLVINCYYRCGTLPQQEGFCSSKEPQPVDAQTPVLQNLYFSNLLVQNAIGAAGYIEGLPEMPVSGIRINNFHVTMASGAEEMEPQEPAMTYEQRKMAGEGFFIRYGEDIQITSSSVRQEKGEAYVIENCTGVEIR
ncbi:MAG TPA: glycoside hydrolase family 28 protein [Candidatus Hungatella pullicola]|nr:glycoside hydrolase family 28 protein [Candidatus Hungatella pullicola]